MVTMQSKGWLVVVGLLCTAGLCADKPATSKTTATQTGARTNTTTGKELIVISSTSCGPCNNLMKELDEVQRRLGKIGVTIKILDREANATEIAALADLPSSKQYKAFPIQHYPMLLPMANGEVVHRIYGYGDVDGLVRIVQSAFQQK